MFEVIFTPAAQAEVVDTRDWYEAAKPSLGQVFITELDACVHKIQSNPKMFGVIMRDLRRILLKKFPYALFFRVEGNVIYIIACFHCSRNPRIWKQRS